jgi:hypothetical protein
VLADTVVQYNHQLGTLSVRHGTVRTPVAIAEVAASRRAFPALRQAEMLHALRAAAAGGAAAGGAAALVDGDGALRLELERARLDAAAATGDGDGGGEPLDSWILRLLEHQRERGALVDRLAASATPFSYARATVEARLGSRHASSVR